MSVLIDSLWLCSSALSILRLEYKIEYEIAFFKMVFSMVMKINTNLLFLIFLISEFSTITINYFLEKHKINNIRFE